MAIQTHVRYVPPIDVARPVVAVRFSADPGESVSVAVTDLATNLNVVVATGDAAADVNDLWTFHYDTADITGLDLESVGHKRLLLHFSSSAPNEQALLTVLPAEGIAALYPDNAVYIVRGGDAGDTPGINGVPVNPCGNLADALSLLSNLNFARLKILYPGSPNAFLLDQDMTGVTLESVSGFPTVLFDPGGGVFEGCTVRRCAVEGDLGDLVSGGLSGFIMEDCITNDDLAFTGILQARNCFFMHTVYQGDAKFVQFMFAIDCDFVSVVDLGPSFLDFQGNDANVILFGMRGAVSIINDTAASSRTHHLVFKGGGDLVLDSTSTGGSTWIIGGMGSVVDLTPNATAVISSAQVDQVGGVQRHFRAVGVMSPTTLIIHAADPADAFLGMSVTVTNDPEGEFTTETRRIIDHETNRPFDITVLTLDSALSFTPVIGDEVTIRVVVQGDLDDVRARLPTALVGGRIDANVGSMDNNVMTAAAASDLTSVIVDAVWRELLADHRGVVGSFAEAQMLIAGLVQNNYVLDSIVNHPTSKAMTSGTIRIFGSAAQVTAATNGGSSEGELATFNVEAALDPLDPSKVDVYKVKRV